MAAHGHWGADHTNDIIAWNSMSRSVMQGVAPEERDVSRLIHSARSYGERDARGGEFDSAHDTDFTDAFEQSKLILLSRVKADEEGVPSQASPVRAACGRIIDSYNEGWSLGQQPVPGR